MEQKQFIQQTDAGAKAVQLRNVSKSESKKVWRHTGNEQLIPNEIEGTVEVHPISKMVKGTVHLITKRRDKGNRSRKRKVS